MDEQRARRGAANRANYATTANLEKRQALQAHATGITGTHAGALLAEIPVGATVVDVGCGNGVWMRLVADGRTVVGLDPSRAMARAARGDGAFAVARGDARALPLRDGSADAVLMLWMLYHVPEKDEALAEARRVLRPGGTLLAATNEASEDGPHDVLIREALARALGRDVDEWIEPLDFHVGNGEEVLARHFDRVAVHEWAVDHELTDPTPLVDHLDSGREPIEVELGSGLPWPEVLDALRALTAEHIARHGSLRFRRRGAAFVAS